MTEIRPNYLKYSLTVILVVCTFFVGSDARANSGAFASASAYAGSSASSLSSVGALGGAGDFSGVYDGHKGIRSYDRSLSHDNADHGVKSYGAGGDGIKGSDHDYNKNDCSKCKWENDDYWERDEPEEEGDENDGDECDDGQYKPDGTRHRGAGGSNKERKPELPLPDVYKTGPTSVYLDDGSKSDRPVGPFDYPLPITGYVASTSGSIGRTPKPGSGGNNLFVYTTLKPEYNGATAGATASVHDTTSSSLLNWNRRTTPDNFAFSLKPWSSSGFTKNFVTTPKPGTRWNIKSGVPTSGQPSSQKSWSIEHDASTSRPGQGGITGFDNTPQTDFSQKPVWNIGRGSIGSFSVTPKSELNWNTRPDSILTEGLPFSRKPEGTLWSTGHDGTSFSTTPKFEQSWNAQSDSKSESTWNRDYGTTSGTSGCPRPDSSCTQGKQGPVKLGATPIGIDKTKDSEPSDDISSAVPQTSGISSLNNYGNPKENQNWSYGQPGTQSTSTYAGASVTSGIGSTFHEGISNYGKNKNPFFNKSPSTQTPYSEIDQTHSNSGIYNPGSVFDYNRPRQSTKPSSIGNTFGTTKRPFGGINSFGVEVQNNTFNPGKLPGALIGSGITSSWLNQPVSESSTWHSSKTTNFPVSTIEFGTTKSPFGYTNIPGSAFGSSYSRIGLKQPSFNAASSSASASVGASAFGMFPGTYSTSYITATTPKYKEVSNYPEVKSFAESTKPTYGTASYDTHSDTSSWPGEQSGSGSKTWPSKQPGSETTLSGHPGTISDTWSGRQPGSISGVWPTVQPSSAHENWSNVKPESNAISGNYPGIGSGIGSIKQSENKNKMRPSIPGCSNANCGDTNIGSYGGSNNCGDGNYNCENNCTEKNNAPVIHGPCSGRVSNGVNKTYYPAGTSNSHVPNIGNTYGSVSPFNNDIRAYSGINIGNGDNLCNQGANVTPEGPVQWNSANPFLFGTGGSISNDVSRPWYSGTTAKPIGVGNPFLDSSWSGRKPEYSNDNANNDQKVIPYNEENRKSISQGNPFLDNKKRVEINPNESLIPLGGRRSEKYNPFFGNGNSGSYDPTYTGRQSDEYPILRTPESAGVKDSFRGDVLSQQENSDKIYPTSENSRGVDPLRCNLGIFGCGTPGSGSYEAKNSGKYPENVFGGIDGIGSGNSRNVDNVSDRPNGPQTGINRSQFGSSHPALAGSSLAGSLGGTYAGSFSNAQASSFANPFLPSSNTAGSSNDGQISSGSWPSGAQNQGSNAWASSSAFASSNSGSWSGNHPTNVKG